MNLSLIPDKYFLLVVFAAVVGIYLVTKDPIFGTLSRDLAVALIAIATGRGVGSVITTNISAKPDADKN